MITLIALLAALQLHAQSSFSEASTQLYSSAYELSNKNLSCAIDQDCVVLEAGRRPCGGSEGFVLASHLNPQFRIVERLVKVGNYIQTQDHTPRFGTCEYVATPEAVCAYSQCEME